MEHLAAISYKSVSTFLKIDEGENANNFSRFIDKITETKTIEGLKDIKHRRINAVHNVWQFVRVC